MIETAASKSCSCSDGAASPYERVDSGGRAETPARRRYNPLLWLNLVCLDAPIVAISWMWLFARRFGIPISPGGTAALFLTAWFIYLADRFADNLSLDQGVLESLRQRFCRQHSISWLVALLLIGLADAFLVLTQLDPRTRATGAAVAALALVYLCLNQFAPAVWRRLPLKEIWIGFLFAAGTLVPLTSGLTRAIAPSWFLFASLCSFNCICIAVWEMDLDLAQRRVSIATSIAIGGRFVVPAALVLCLTSGVLRVPEIFASATLLAAVHIFRNKIQPDVRTALADLVLLTPIAAIVL